MGSAGLLLGFKGQDTPSDAWWTVLIAIWFAGIGLGLGSIFDQKHPKKRIIVYWAATLGLIAPFWSLPIGWAIRPGLANLSFGQQAIAGVIGILIGTLLGVIAGIVHLKRLHRRSPSSHSGAVA